MTLLRDLRYAISTLRRSPGYTVMCIAVLALGIGANAAIFSVLNGVILQALPYRDPSRLVFVWERFPSMPPPIGPRMSVARLNYLEWQKQNNVFSEMAAFRGRTLDETGIDHPRHVTAGFASANLFPLLGIQARIGRLFRPEEERQGSDRVIVLTDAYFEKRFGRDGNAIGKTMSLDGIAYTVIGVLPPKFHVPSTYEGTDQLKAEVWIPLSRLWNRPADDRERQLLVVARLKPGVSLEQARTEMNGLAERLAKTYSDMNQGWMASVFDFKTEDTGREIHLAIYVLMAAVGFLLLIACANLANLTLARATMRSREIAVRLALGASRRHIISQLITESFLVSLAGAALGLLLANWCIRLMLALQPEGIMRPELIHINVEVFAFSAFASIVTTVLFGLAPSIAVSRPDLNTALKSGGWGTSAARWRSRQFLIAIEVALALVLVVGAGLMIRSFQEMLAVGVGFRIEATTIADVDLPANRYPDGPSRARFHGNVMERVAASPGITAAAVVDNPPLHRISMANFYIAGRPDPPISNLPMADMVRATPGYFSLIGLRLETGRMLTDSDLAFTDKGPNAIALVNRAFVKQFFPNQNPLGQHLLSPDRKQSSEIVGVISDYRPMGVENGTRPTIFWASLQMPTASIMVRSSMASQTLSDLLRNTIWSVDSNLPPSEVQPMQHYVDEWLSQRKFNTILLGIFAGLAVALGMIGIYGILSNLVAARTREIGIRMAIGAAPSEIARLILRQSMFPVLIGLVVGFSASLVLGRFLEALLYNVRPRDPLTLAGAILAILLIAPAAVYIPMRRATRVECTVALRDE